MRILGGQSAGCVYHQEADIRSFDGVERSQHAVLFHSGLDVAPAADTGCVDQGHRETGEFQVRVDGVPGRAGDRADDRPLFSQHTVQQAGFADVRFAHNGNLDRFILFLLLAVCLDGSHQCIQQIAGPGAMESRDRIRLADTQLIELHRLDAARFAIGFIHHQENRRERLTMSIGLVSPQDLRPPPGQPGSHRSRHR